MRYLCELMFTVEGRLSRRSFWLYYLIGIVIVTPLIAFTVSIAKSGGSTAPALTLVTAIVSLLWLLGAIAVGIKRLHDLNKSGIMYLIAFIPYIGQAWILIYLGFFPGSPHRNRFGNPTT
jgi:uncharacterized membrane protein YhaH (DUF805 family)